jgi:hypothetical protein
MHARQACIARAHPRPGRFEQNLPVHQFHINPPDSTRLYRFNYIYCLLSEPDQFKFWFGLLAVRPSVRSGPNNYANIYTWTPSHLEAMRCAEVDVTTASMNRVWVVVTSPHNTTINEHRTGTMPENVISDTTIRDTKTKHVTNNLSVTRVHVTPGFKNKTRYTPYVSPGSQISHIATNKGNTK